MFLTSFITMLFRILQLAILARVILSWVSPYPRLSNPLINIIWQITEPIMAPLRRFTTFGMMDFSGFAALILLQILESLLLQLVAGVR